MAVWAGKPPKKVGQRSTSRSPIWQPSKFHNSALIPPTEALDPSLESSLRALPVSTPYHCPCRSSSGSLGRKTSRESLEKVDLEDRLLSPIKSVWGSNRLPLLDGTEAAQRSPRYSGASTLDLNHQCKDGTAADALWRFQLLPSSPLSPGSSITSSKGRTSG